MNRFAGPILVILVAMISIQSGASLAKTLFPRLGSAGTTGLRLTFATLILWAIWRPWKNIPRTAAQLKPLLGYGFSLGAMNLFFYLALERIPLGIAVAIEFTGPLGIALLATRKPADFVWALLAAIGIILIVPRDQSATALDLVGIGFALAAGFCWGLYIFFGQRAAQVLPSGVVVSLGMSIATAIGLSGGLLIDGAKLWQFSIWPKAFLMAIFSSALPYSLEMIALKKLPAQVFGILMSAEPAVAALCGFAFLGERLSLRQTLAIGLVIVASTGVSTGQAKSRGPKTAPLA